ncbi:hypothetical protein CTAYLR_007733 [Chrysophaeum taylorii]|uniref:Uncharacterized protein n=1 Tax=Chrysophaeum taylorii TaxID=2483200 RepID=A0AAD7UNR9_9STRA|nr:hypothetical protein CTAYLR_007733 [Chrysophaeum taylorii]
MAAEVMNERQREQARVHARFTRQRKQELIDKLQSQYTELLNHQLKNELKAHEHSTQSKLLKQKVVQLLDLWSDEPKAVDSEVESLLDPQIRAFLPSEEDEETLTGIEEVLKGLSLDHRLGLPELRFAVEVSVDSMFTGSRAAMAPFWYKSYNALECGASREVRLRAVAYCEFSKEMISGAKVVYDRAAWSREVAEAFTWDLPKIPGSIFPQNLNQAYAAMASADKPMILTTLAPPREIVRVTERYCRLTGYHPREVLGNALMWLDPPDDQRSRLAELVSDLRRGTPLEAMMVHPTNVSSTKSGTDAVSGIYTFTQAYPLKHETNGSSSSKFTHCLWVLKDPPVQPVVPCVRSLFELSVRIATAMRQQPPAPYADQIFRLLDSMLVQIDGDQESTERHCVLTMWELYRKTRELLHSETCADPVAKVLGGLWSKFFAQVRAAGADEPFASFIERAKYFSTRDEAASFILRRFASLALNFHRDWVSGGTINDSVPDDKKGEVERAVAVYSKVIETWPQYGQAWNRRARAYFLLGDYDRAADDLAEALKLQPNNSSAWVGRMLVNMKLQHYASALEAYKHAIKLNPALAQKEDQATTAAAAAASAAA